MTPRSFRDALRQTIQSGSRSLSSGSLVSGKCLPRIARPATRRYALGVQRWPVIAERRSHSASISSTSCAVTRVSTRLFKGLAAIGRPIANGGFFGGMVTT